MFLESGLDLLLLSIFEKSGRNVLDQVTKAHLITFNQGSEGRRHDDHGEGEEDRLRWWKSVEKKNR